MAKPKMYGLKTKSTTRLLLDQRYHRKQRQRNRERAPRNPVADQSAKEKEGQA